MPQADCSARRPPGALVVAVRSQTLQASVLMHEVNANSYHQVWSMPVSLSLQCNADTTFSCTVLRIRGQ